MSSDERFPTGSGTGDASATRVATRHEANGHSAPSGTFVDPAPEPPGRASVAIRTATASAGRARSPLRRAVPIYLTATSCLAAVYLFVPALFVVAWALIVLSSLTAFAVGIARHNPRRRQPWLLLGAGYMTLAAGTVVALVVVPGQFPSLADLVFLGGSLPLLLGGLIGLTRSGARFPDRASMLDAVILTIGAGFLAWTFLINPFLQDPTLGALEKAVSIAYPLSDVLTLAILARLGLAAARNTSLAFLLASGAGLLTADVLYGLSRLEGIWQLGGPIDLGWLVFYIAGGAAALHPSMIRLTEPHVLTRTQVSLRRGVLTFASLLAPAALLVQALRGPVLDGVLIAVVSAALILLSLARMSAVTDNLRQALARERELREACEALLASTSADETDAVLRRAVGRMLPPGTEHRVVLELHSEPEVVAAALGNLTGGLELRYVVTLPPEVAEPLARFELALHCRLAVGDARVGDLFVGADEPALIGLQEAVPVLAGQAATMLDRIRLNREISRRDSQAYFRTLVLNATEVIAIVGEDNRITYVSPAAEQVIGTADLVGSDLLDLIDEEDRDEVRDLLDATRRGMAGEGLNQWQVRRTDGTLVCTEAVIGDMRREPGVNGLVVTLRDVTERQRLEQELIARAYVDPLTGLGNRLRFQDDVAAAAGRRSGLCGVMIINIDGFRVVNDTMGHEVGDELLIAVGKRLSSVLAGRGTLARLGADEFGAVVEDASDVAHIERLAEQVVHLSTETFHVGGSLAAAHLRAGVATTADARTAKELLSQADVALDTVPSSGGRRWRRYEASLHAEVLDRMQLRTDLDRAFAEDAFVLNYQPIVELGEARTVGFEALLRWPHPERGMVSPATFIPLAEESGLIVELGAWVLRTAVATAAEWHRKHPHDTPYVSVNVSVRQFRSPDFVDQVFAELSRSGLPARLLTLEITESLLLGEHDRIHADIARLRAAGIKMSIDDFGTGYSSLSYLHRVPVDTLKLDKSFVDTITGSGQQLDLVRGIIQLAATLNLDVVAEGIETPEEHHLLKEAGCRLGQGFLFNRPMTEADAARLINGFR
ncbi:putative bifunctional diguanylate cyclase/phosphodiesterase [Couchioplanes caeruleus]|uniref:PAS domain S-box-containing protein/diguanylate cyclase (GGDEF)-like protein n=1 Tax=Couchioplanes caeruleus TaxID=56438 RepID=A0A3N1GPC6_9ACTN|nr:bifunctional diguanylate cyclase/phosphodiesterase [Couchioplanes caeruleus]ROP32099.1 PAS domain S-box-containing protein/diguanylate cyclase (GGDEF)-like protein [Couchioplanes caeruleus]